MQTHTTSSLIQTRKSEHVIGVIRANFGWLGVSFIAFSYLLFSLVDIQEKDATILMIILGTATSLLVGFSINRMLDIQGINVGLTNPQFMEVDKIYYDTVRGLGDARSNARPFCQLKNTEALKEVRTTILTYAGLEYDKVFNEEGIYNGHLPSVEPNDSKDVIQDKKNQIKHIRWAVRHRITQITPVMLLADDTKTLDPNYLGKKISEYTYNSIRLDLIVKLLPAFIFGRLTVGLINGFSVHLFIWHLVEISLYVLMGLIKYYTSYNFITTNYRQRLINKINYLEELKSFKPQDGGEA
jgi:hypothetical protein